MKPPTHKIQIEEFRGCSWVENTERIKELDRKQAVQTEETTQILISDGILGLVRTTEGE